VAFTWSDFNVLAAALAMNADESSLRSATSRAYYSVFGTARDRATTQGYVRLLDGSSSHKSLWTFFTASTVLQRRQFGLDGLRLHRQRLSADYDNPLPGPPAVAAQDAVTEATRMLGLVHTI